MRSVRRLGASVLVAALALAGCATGAPPAEHSDVPGAIAIESVPLPDEVRPLWLTVYPTPLHAEYGGALLPLDAADRVDDASPEFEACLGETGLEAGWQALRREGYVLAVGARAGKATVVLAARDDAGRRWAEQALAQ